MNVETVNILQSEFERMDKRLLEVLDILKTQRSANLPTKWTFDPFTTHGALVGAEASLEELKQILLVPSLPGGPAVVCLHGMGGVGKTTLAMQIHDSDEMRSKFRDKIMYVACGEARTRPEIIGMVYRQWRTQTGADHRELDEAEKKCAFLKRKMKDERFLMVFDDACQSDQIDWIREVFPENCRVIVTTRNREVVQIPGTKCFHVEPLREGESFRLFCHFAFGRQVSPPDLDDVARKVCKQCGGLPLALKVVASSICPRNQDRGLWDQWHEFLKGAHPAQCQPGAVSDFHRKVIKTLQRSIEALAEIDPSGCVMDMFLDLAGFPEDERVSRDLVEAQWSIYPSCGDYGLETARERLNAMVSLSLVEAHGDSYVSLHDMIRKAALDMINSVSAPTVTLGGMSRGGGSVECANGFRQRLFLLDRCPPTDSTEEAEIHESTRKFMLSTSSGSTEEDIPDSSLEMPHLVSFYWSWPREVLFFVDENEEDAHLSLGENSLERGREFLQQVTSSSPLQIMTLLNFPKPSVLPHDYFSSFLNLRVLWVEFFGTSSDEEFPCSIRHLRKLEVLVIDFSCNAAAFSAKLSISPEAISELRQLRVLRMCGVAFLKGSETGNGVLPFLLSSPCLQDFSISLSDTVSLSDQDIPSSIGNLTRLRSIKLEGSYCLKEVPPAIGCLTKLVKLSIINSWDLRSLPVTIGLLSSLTRLEILSSKLESIPDDIGDLQSLVHLSIKSARLRAVPPAVGRLSRLTSLDLSDSLQFVESIPEAFWVLTQLRQLSLERSGLRCLPEEIGNLTELRELNLSFSGFRSLPLSIGMLCMLTRLNLSSSFFLCDLGMGISGLSSLRCLSLQYCTSLTFLSDGICKLGNLTRLNLSGCSTLASLPDEMGWLSQLRVLNLQYAQSLESLPDSVSNLGRLMELNLSNCTSLTKLPRSIPNLKELKLSLHGCARLRNLRESLIQLLRLRDRSKCPKKTPMETSAPHESEFLEAYDNGRHPERLKRVRKLRDFARAGDPFANLNLLDELFGLENKRMN
ncbi:hypothetical protein CBR_g37007 [Chara braunii]|uniref:Uncharacterized protein n=1 Tax=Chara braunii TaxID=69332 RepID=A0A388LM39_CHABU|nr:hypothetical protein CBR_g37007 [Chara braunii]|eukprot:GBG83295.1 hypothetical protein CBR_g37007 [Chara braunii]